MTKIGVSSMGKKIEVFRNGCRAAVNLPGSKSVTNRAMILAALTGGRARLEGALFSRDTLIMADCLSRLGCRTDLHEEERAVEIVSGGAREFASSADLFVGNAGTAARFVTAAAALRAGGVYSFDSDRAMYSRPMKGLFDSLRDQGSRFEFFGKPDCFPFKMFAGGLRGGEIRADASASSQILSALLMAAPFADTPAEIRLEGATVSLPFVAMTLAQMGQFGLCARSLGGGRFSAEPAKAAADGRRSYSVEPDATAASYFAMLAALTGGAVLLRRFGECRLQGDADFLRVLEEAGLARLAPVGGDMLVISSVPGGRARLCRHGFDFNAISDTFLTLAAAAPLLDSPVEICGIAHTRAQETDRIAAVCAELSKLGADAREAEGSVRITPPNPDELARRAAAAPAEIRTYDDHRIAMAFSIAGCVNLGPDCWIEIENPECVSKTWPDFFERLDRARADSEKFATVAVDGGAAVGKSSVSRECSKALGYLHVDTGAHYRTVAFGLLERGIAPSDVSAIEGVLSELKLGAVIEGGSARMTLNGDLADDSLIRSRRVNENVAGFAALAQVRGFLKNYQRSMADFARKNGFGGLIMEGRDIGSVIFPDADVKIFLDADEATRAGRRAKEGISDSITKRDAMDRSRKTAPLVCAEGAVKIDTSHMTKEEVVAKTLSLILESQSR